jgi:lysophospholipase L1-like esterase
MALGRRAGALLNAVLVVASVALSLAAVELYLAWDNWRPRFEHTTLEFGAERFRVMEPARALRDFHNTAAVLGDSFTHGAACGGERNYPGHLGRLVREHGDPYRVVNLGVSGADPFMYLSLLEGLRASGQEPSFVVVTLYANDIEFSCSLCAFLERIRGEHSFSAEELARLESFCRARCTAATEVLGMAGTGHYGALRRLHTWLLTKFYVYGLLRDTLARVTMALGVNVGWGRAAYPPLWQDHRSLEFRLVKFALAGIRDALGGPGTRRMTVVIYPDVQDLRKDNVYVGIYHGVEEHLSAVLGVPVASGYAAFLGNAEAKPNMSYSLTDNHPSCKAHELFAKWVFTRMESDRAPLLRTGGR